MESKTKNRKTREQVAQMVERAFGGATLAAGDDAVDELKEGWFNAAYSVRLSDGREVILKIAPLKDAVAVRCQHLPRLTHQHRPHRHFATDCSRFGLSLRLCYPAFVIHLASHSLGRR